MFSYIRTFACGCVRCSEQVAESVLERLAGRWYAGAQLAVARVRVPSWERALCARFLRTRCPRLDSCHYLHALENPRADSDERPAPAPAAAPETAAPATATTSDSAEEATRGPPAAPTNQHDGPHTEAAGGVASGGRSSRCTDSDGDELREKRRESRSRRSRSRRRHSDSSRERSSSRDSPSVTHCGVRKRSHRHQKREHRLSLRKRKLNTSKHNHKNNHKHKYKHKHHS